MLPPPHNLKTPKDPTLLLDFVRDSAGNIISEDGSALQIDANKNLKRDEQKNFFLLDGTIVPVHQEGADR